MKLIFKSISIYILLISPMALAAEYGIFMVVKGKVIIENSKSSHEAKVNSKVQVGDTIVTVIDSRAKIVMSDRNIINISPNTRLKIEKYTNSVEDKNVHLNLIEGKVRSHVEQKYDNESSKFEVRTATAVAGVRGTQFVTSYDKVTRITEVITFKGQVAFKSVAAGNTPVAAEPVIIEKGERSQTQEGAAPAPPVKIPEKEFKLIDSETAIKGKPPEENVVKSPVAPPNLGEQLPPPPGTQLIDLNRGGNSQIKDDTATRKYDRSKVRIITQPGQ